MTNFSPRFCVYKRASSLFTGIPFKTDIPQAVASLVFLGIASSIRESVSASDKLSNFESAEA